MAPTKYLPLLCTLLAVSSCSKVEDMHDATISMNGTTSEMNATTARMAKITEDMANTMNEVMDSGRQGAALDLRSKRWDDVVNGKSLEQKSTNAGLYFQAFEFQLWNNLGLDKLTSQREVFMYDAAKEFFCHLLDISHTDEVNPFAGKGLFSPSASANEEMSFNALSIVLEEMNRKQLHMNAVTGKNAINMLSMIETALLAGKDMREGKSQLRDYPAYVEMILAHEKNAIRLLRARHQMLGLVVLTQLTKIGQNKLEGFKYKFLGSKWAIDFTKLNEAELNLARFRLSEARRARDFLSQLGLQEELDPSIKSIYSHARIENLPSISSKDGDGVVSEASGTPAQQAFLNALKNYAQ